MKRALISIVVAAAMIVPLPVLAHDMPSLFDVYKSVVKIQVGTGHCTGFSVDKGKRLYSTTAHCLGSRMRIDDQDVMPIVADYDGDILIVQGGNRRPALRLGQRPYIGQDVFPIGYGKSSPYPLVFAANFQYMGDPWNQGGNHFVLNVGLIPGMSGGPIVDSRGEVVSVVSLTGYPDDWFQMVGGGSPWENLKVIVNLARGMAK